MNNQLYLSDIFFYSMDNLNSTYVVIRAELDNPINKVTMIKAFDEACKRFPYFQTKLKKNDIGYELINNEHKAVVHEDPLDYLINASDNDEFLYRFSINGSVITLSFFHGIGDATSMMEFMKVILHEYYKELGELSNISSDNYALNTAFDEKETLQPLDLISEDTPSKPYSGSTFYNYKGKKTKDAVAYTFSANTNKVMDYVKANDSTPNSLTSIALAKAIYEIEPKSLEKGIDISISINAKPLVKADISHWPFIYGSTFHYDAKAFKMDEDMLDTCVRGKIFADCDNSILYPELAGVRTLTKMFPYLLHENARKLLCLKSTSSPRCSANVSYARSDWGVVEKHLKSLYTFGDAAVPLFEINSIGNTFYFSMSATFDTRDFVGKIHDYFNSLGFECSPIKQVTFKYSKGKKNTPHMGLNSATLHLIKGIKQFRNSN